MTASISTESPRIRPASVADAVSLAAVHMLEANARARRFYEHRGWKLVRGQVLDWPGLDVREVRYRLPLVAPSMERISQ